MARYGGLKYGGTAYGVGAVDVGSWTLLAGGNHGGRDWVVSGDVMAAGVHYNVGALIVEQIEDSRVPPTLVAARPWRRCGTPP